MKYLTGALGVGLLGFCMLGLTGCGEDNEAAVQEQASKVKDTIPPDKATPPINSMDEYRKRNPGMSSAASGSGKAKPATDKTDKAEKAK